MGQAIAPIYDTEADRIKEQLATAAALRKQGMSGDIGSGYQGGKVFIVGNPLGNIAASLGGEFLGRRAREAQGAMEQRQQQERDAFLAAMPSATETQHYDPVANPGTGPLVEGMEVPRDARALAQATQAWAAKAPRGMEGVQNFALQQALTAPQRQAELEAKAVEAKALAAQRAEDKRIADQERRDWQAQQNELYKRTAEQQSAHLAAALAARQGTGAASKPQLVYGEDNQAYQLFQDGSIRKVEGLKKPMSAAQDKLAGERAGKEANKVSVSAAADDTLKAMEEAHKLGAYTDKGNNLAQSVVKYGLATEVGKEVGRAANLPSQTARDIADTKKMDLFLNSVKNSLTASQLNSDSELRIWMQTIGNPRSSYEAQVSAIKGIKQKYGDKIANAAAPEAAAPAPAPAAPAAKRMTYNPATGRLE